MALIADYVMDNGLTVIDTDANRFDICDSQPTTYTQAITTYSKGNKTGITVGAPTNGDTDGRKVVMTAISGGTVSGTATVNYWAITDTVNLRLLAVGTLTAHAVTSGNTFSTTTDIDITIRDA